MSRLDEGKCPCYNCEDRHVACHSTCEGYKSYKDNRLAMKEKLRNDMSIDHIISSLAVQRNKKRRKKK